VSSTTILKVLVFIVIHLTYLGFWRRCKRLGKKYFFNSGREQCLLLDTKGIRLDFPRWMAFNGYNKIILSEVRSLAGDIMLVLNQ